MGFLEAIATEDQIKKAVKVLAPMPVNSPPLVLRVLNSCS